MDEEKIKNLEAKLYLNLIYAGKAAQRVNGDTLNSKLSADEGEMLGALIAMSQTVAELMTAKGKK